MITYKSRLDTVKVSVTELCQKMIGNSVTAYSCKSPYLLYKIHFLSPQISV